MAQNSKQQIKVLLKHESQIFNKSGLVRVCFLVIILKGDVTLGSQFNILEGDVWPFERVRLVTLYHLEVF
jgi:hypothetical protein